MTEQINQELEVMTNDYMEAAKEDVQAADVEIMGKLRKLAGESEETYQKLTSQAATMLRTKFLAKSIELKDENEAGLEAVEATTEETPVEVVEAEATEEVAE